MAVLHARRIKYGTATKHIPVELEIAKPELIAPGGTLKLVRRDLKRADTVMFSSIGNQKSVFLPNCSKYGLKMLLIGEGITGTPVLVVVVVTKVVLMVKGG